MRFKDKAAIVTGGAQGLGEAIALRLAADGANVIVADLNGEASKEAAAKIAKATGRKAIGIKVDVTEEKSVVSMVKLCMDNFKRLDVLVSNAGILIAEDITDFPVDKWKKVIDVNLNGFFIAAKEAAKVMKAQKSGAIIQINSKSGKKGSFRNSAYAASKFGGIGLTQSIALDLAPFNVRVNSVCPGNLLDSPLWVNSLYEQYAKKWGISKEEVRKKYVEQVPLKRGCTYEDVCNVVSFLASEEASYMTGQAINVTGGQEMR